MPTNYLTFICQGVGWIAYWPPVCMYVSMYVCMSRHVIIVIGVGPHDSLAFNGSLVVKAVFEFMLLCLPAFVGLSFVRS